MSRARVAIVAVAVSILSVVAGGDARAESRSWAVARKVLPAGDYFFLGVNVGSIRSHAMFPRLYPALLATMGDVKDGLEAIKTTCGIDAVASVGDAAMAIDASDTALTVLALRGVSRDQVHACIKKLFPGEISSRKVDRIDEYWFGDGSGPKLHAVWLASDVVAFAGDLLDRAVLERLIGGKGVAPVKINTDASAWLVYTKTTSPGRGLTFKGSQGTIELGKTDIIVQCRSTMGSVKQAADALAMGKQEIADAAKATSVPRALVPIIQKVKLATEGADLTLRATLNLQDLVALVALAIALA